MEWTKVAELDELPLGSGFRVEVGGRDIALFRVGEEVFAIENECPHYGSPLDEGDLDGEVVTCPFHAWQINVRSGEVVMSPGLCTRTFPCRVENGSVFVEPTSG
jgi:NAD(P)H-dependent nitrite reductase small subunit